MIIKEQTCQIFLDNDNEGNDEENQKTEKETGMHDTRVTFPQDLYLKKDILDNRLDPGHWTVCPDFFPSHLPETDSFYYGVHQVPHCQGREDINAPAHKSMGAANIEIKFPSNIGRGEVVRTGKLHHHPPDGHVIILVYK
jgi:hypothetical protein